MALVFAGVPFDVAFSASDDMRVAWCIMLGESKGGQTFDFNANRWVVTEG